MTPKKVEDLVNSALDFAYEQGTTVHRTDPSRSSYLRVSSLPYCARQNWLNLVFSLSRNRTEQTSGLYYMHLGTAVHELLQGTIESCTTEAFFKEHEKRLPNRSVLVQDWLCKNCGHRHRFVPRPSACDWCGEHGDRMKPLEHQVRYGKVTLGHMDGTLAFPDADDPKAPYSKRWIHVPWDYKTCSLAVAASKGKLPYEGNKVQLTTYGAIKYNEGYNVPGVTLIYIPRDNPRQRKSIYVPLKAKEVLSKLDGYEQLFFQVKAADTLAKGLALPPKVDTGFATKCEFCKYVSSCEAAAKGNLRPLTLQAEKVIKFLHSPTRNSSWPEA